MPAPPDDLPTGTPADDPGKYPGAPRWVKVAAVVVLALVVLVALFLAFGPGEHGPGRHTGDPARGQGDGDLAESVPARPAPRPAEAPMGIQATGDRP